MLDTSLCQCHGIVMFLGGNVMLNEKKNKSVPLWEKFLLSVSEASEYFNIGDKQLRNLISNSQGAEWLFYNGERIMIKREKFENFINETPSI